MAATGVPDKFSQTEKPQNVKQRDVKVDLNPDRCRLTFTFYIYSFAVLRFRQRALDNFIQSYNAAPGRAFELFRAQANDSSTLRITLLTTQLVSPGDQAAGVLVSMAGLSLPFILAAADAPILLFFYYFPNVRTMTELSLSEDINGATELRKGFILASPGFLKSPERQIKKHTVSFHNLLKMLVTQVARQNARKKANLVANAG